MKTEIGKNGNIYYVNVGSLSKIEATEYIEKLMIKHKNKKKR